jgi:Pyridoxamine 5'-phosphate oxidase
VYVHLVREPAEQAAELREIGLADGHPGRPAGRESAVDDADLLAGVARTIIDSNVYMTLGTADADGRPWVSPVYFAAEGYREFYWISSPEVTHSRNLAARPEVSIVVFDSRAVVGAGGGQAVYLAGVAGLVEGAEVERGLRVYPGPPERGARRVELADVQPPGPYRLYRASIAEHSMLCPRTSGPCGPHGRPYDHRTVVNV